MREFLLLCEYLDTHLIHNSNLKGNINPNKVAGDVPLAPSAQNISKVSTDMPISTSKDEEKSRANEASSSSSAKAERIISGKPESRTNLVPSGTKVFLSFQVGKQHPKEEEYLAFTRYIYNLPEESEETYGVLGTTNCRVIDQDHDWVLITKGRSKSSELKERLLDIELHRLGATEETWKLACKMLDHDHP
ncbi:hypothetical protein H5410_038254 [Solanum commersonii]|uniref:Uncharacterized protein n=1 Tax=Solanum commersonii TaxID=4109 RepID=A0A9J5YDF6_SOLCO|nr:hypothetical protein H5410_038254 [Solanum commersonii]